MNNLMDCCRSEDDREARLIDKRIKRELRKYKKESRKETKLLLLGPGESGKSTFIKQMRIIHGKGYSDKEKRDFIHLVYQNVFMAMQNLAKGMKELELRYETSEALVDAKALMQVDYTKIQELTEEQISIIRYLWRDSGVRSCYLRRNEFQISDSAGYFLDSLDRVVAPGYLPTKEDILRARLPTTGIQEYCFDFDKHTRFRIVDVGGQRSERRKWLHCFESVTSIIFLAALSEYDQRLLESRGENRLEESIMLFKVILANDLFTDTSFILFLNKTDLLREKIKYSHLADHFPEFHGPRNDANAAIAFIQSKFTEAAERKQLYPYHTCATDTENIRNIFAAVKDTVLYKNITDYNLV